MTTHTPTPWTIGARTDGHATSIVSAVERQWYQSAGGEVPLLIANMAARNGNSYAEMGANAALIVRAVNAHAVLVGALERIASGVDAGTIRMPANIGMQVSAALAQAAT